MISFVKHFSKYNWSFEFILSWSWLNKSLFCFNNNDFKRIQKYIETIFWNKKELDNIFNLYWSKINHIWIDTLNNRYKIYINLYNVYFNDSLKIISKIKKILWIDKKYYLEKDFLKFDCIWIDISSKWFDLKIYELIDLYKDERFLYKYINFQNIKEVWYLKNFNWRRKNFFRFKNNEDIDIFKCIFDLESLENFQNDIKDFYKLKFKVKYYCLEDWKEELYFI